MTEETLPSVLCVDDEIRVLEALKRQLRGKFAVATAMNGPMALEVMRREGPFAVVMSDLRMPGMDGVTLLGRIRDLAPDTVRVLLTGNADLKAAMAAVNQGNIFRLLTKPCPTPNLIAAIEAAAEQHRLIQAERTLLEQTLLGSVKVLTELLALAHPMAFGRACRARQHVARLVQRLEIPNRWEHETAAMLSQIGWIAAPPDLVEKLHRGEALEGSEKAAVARLPRIAEELLSNIPRLETIREILACQDRAFDGSGDARDRVAGERLPLGARILKIVLDFDTLESQGRSVEECFRALRARSGTYDPELLQAFEDLVTGQEAESETLALSVRELRPGMILVTDVVSLSGKLLVSRGHEVSVGMLERLRNFAENIGLREPVRVSVARHRPEDEAPDSSSPEEQGVQA